MDSRNMFDLKGKVVVVAGGAGLIGKELVRGFAGLGAAVILADADGIRAKAVARECKNACLKAVPRRLNIAEEKSINEFIKSIHDEYRRIDVWVNAAYPRTKDWSARFEKVTSKSWSRNVDAHLNGYFLCCQKAAEYMRAQGSGSIINLSSIYGLVGPDFSVYKGTSMTMPAAYSAIKGGIIGFTRYLASYYGRYDVRVNCVSPGGVYNGQPGSFVKRYEAKTPLKRMANPDDIVGGVIYLASDAARYVTGHNLVIDGGWSAI